MRLLSFLIGGLVNDDAVRLKALCDLTVRKYMALPPETLRDEIARDFPGRSHFDSTATTFSFDTMPDFRFFIDHPSGSPRSLRVHGYGQYAGYMLQGFDTGTRWASLVTDGIAYSATGGAKKLARVMQKKFGIRDNSAYLKAQWH